MGPVNEKHRPLLSGVRITRIQGLTRSYAIKMARRFLVYLVVFLGIVTVSMWMVFGIADWQGSTTSGHPKPYGDPLRRDFIYALIGLSTIPATAAAIGAVWLIRRPRVRMAGYVLVILTAAFLMASAVHFFRSDETWCAGVTEWADCLDEQFAKFRVPVF